MTLEFIYVAVSSTKVKMQDGRKTNPNKTEHQDRAQLKKKEKEKDVVEWGKQDFRGCGEGISKR